MKPLSWLVLCGALAAAGATYAADAPKIEGPLYLTTYIEVAPDAAGSALAALKAYRDGSLKEGATAIDIFQESGQLNRFVVDEIWKDQSSAEMHGKAAVMANLADKLKPVSFKPIDVRPHTLYAGTPYKAPRAGDLFVISHLDVYGPGVPVLQAAFKPLEAESRKESGMVRYEILDQAIPHANHFRMFEEWASEKAWAAHNLSSHVQAFHAALPVYLGTPYDQRLYRLAN
jgi:quinol monooxygenase YgiN